MFIYLFSYQSLHAGSTSVRTQHSLRYPISSQHAAGIDIFSPRLDLSSNSSHTKRRIWQEAITTLLLTDEHCRIPKEQRMVFKQARQNEYPPYLLNFKGSPGERHVENLKVRAILPRHGPTRKQTDTITQILREVGGVAYTKAARLISGPDYEWFRYLEETILEHFIGPDCYWKPHAATPRRCTKFFGNAWWIPFPPTLVSTPILGDIACLHVLFAPGSRVRRRTRSGAQRGEGSGSLRSREL